MKILKIIFNNFFVKAVVIIILSFYLFRNSYSLLGILKYDLNFIVNNQDLSYAQKMETKVGKVFYDYTLFVKRNTPENAVILIPPQVYPWLQSGNIAYLRYFLYPRRLLNGKTPKDFNNPNLNFVLLASGDSVAPEELSKTTWPQIKVSAKRILLEISPNDRNSKAQVIDGDYLPEKFKGERGIIELR